MTLIKSIYKEPEKWQLGEFRLSHQSGATLWIANGRPYCQPENGSFGFFEKWRVWRAFRWWCRNTSVENFGGRCTEHHGRTLKIVRKNKVLKFEKKIKET